MKRQRTPYLNRDRAQIDIRDIKSELYLYKKSEDMTGSVVNSLRGASLLVASSLFTDLHNRLDPAYKVAFTTGREPVQGSIFVTDPYDNPREEHTDISPQTVVPFELIKLMQWEGSRQPIFYVGSYAVFLSLPSLAETLSAGGQLSLVETDQAMSA